MLFPQEQEEIHGRAGGHVLKMFEWIESVNRRPAEAVARHDHVDEDKYDASHPLPTTIRSRGCWRRCGSMVWRRTRSWGVFSDHGEEFLDHGFLAHGGIHLYEELIRTVGIVHDPGAAPKRVDTPRGHAGILPTLMARAGVPMSSALAAADFDAQDGSAPVFCEGEFKVAMRRGSRKWIKPLPRRTSRR